MHKTIAGAAGVVEDVIAYGVDEANGLEVILVESASGGFGVIFRDTDVGQLIERRNYAAGMVDGLAKAQAYFAELTKGFKVERLVLCSYDGCAREGDTECDCCLARFCSDHGSEGGDDSPFDDAVARPAVCFKCGGFNVDA